MPLPLPLVSMVRICKHDQDLDESGSDFRNRKMMRTYISMSLFLNATQRLGFQADMETIMAIYLGIPKHSWIHTYTRSKVQAQTGNGTPS